LKKLFVVVLFFVAVIVNAQEERVNQIPVKPTINDIVSITYLPKNQVSAIKNLRDLNIVIVFWDEYDYIMKMIPMLKDGDNFTVNITFPSDSIVYITYKFISETEIDNNDYKWWESFIYNSKGVEVQGGHYQKALSSLLSYDLTRHITVAETLQEIDRELELYPNNILAKQTKWINDYKRSTDDAKKNEIRKEIRSAYDKWKNNEDIIRYIAYAANVAEMEDLLVLTKDYYMKKNPTSKLIKSIDASMISNEKDTNKQITLIQNYVRNNKYQDYEHKDMFIATLYDHYVAVQDNNSIKELLKNYDFTDDNYTINLADIELGRKQNLAELEEFVDRALERLFLSDVSSKPSYMLESSFIRDRDFKIGVLSAMKGRLRFELGDTLQATHYLDLYYKNILGERHDYNSLYVECLIKNELYEDALAISSEIIRRDRFLPSVEKYYEIAYINVYGSADGFGERLKKDMAEREKTQKTDLWRNKINQPLPDFSIKNMDGTTVTPSNLKGKVVIIDFWAVWCEPCRVSLPFFQKAYNKYKDNKNVIFFDINTLERLEENERSSFIKSFINSNNYTFSILMDEPELNLAARLGVKSLPTKFAIDPNGNIQFSSIGFYGEDEMLKEIDSWIELLLQNN
jgi:thiol-disulfide isomerase/thioredoxin